MDARRRDSRRRRRDGNGLVAIPYSLSFDGINDVVSCGSDPSVMDLHNGDFTVDAYVRIPAAADLVATAYMAVSQTKPLEGWGLYFYPPVGNDAFYWIVNDNWNCNRIFNATTLPQWAYLRARKSGTTTRISVNAGTEGIDAAGGPVDTSLSVLKIGAGAGFWYKGLICYVHIWNNDQGALSAVPTSPFALGANTVARYTFGEGTGLALADDSGNGNNGTIDGATWDATVPDGWSIG